MALSGKELESHKAKRLVARNEMIGAAQVSIQTDELSEILAEEQFIELLSRLRPNVDEYLISSLGT